MKFDFVKFAFIWLRSDGCGWPHFAILVFSRFCCFPCRSGIRCWRRFCFFPSKVNAQSGVAVVWNLEGLCTLQKNRISPDTSNLISMWAVGVASFSKAIVLLLPLGEGNTTDPPGGLAGLGWPQLLTPIDQSYRAFSRIRLGLRDETKGRLSQKNVIHRDDVKLSRVTC